MFNRLFGKKKPDEEILIAPLSGKVIGIEQVPDLTFSEKMLGDGVAIDPSRGEVVSPVEGEIVQVFESKHAVGIRSAAGLEILIHVGLETVAMQGEGFDIHVNAKDKVKAGDPLLTFDLDLVKEKADSTVSPIVITNGDKVERIEKMYSSYSHIGETEIMQVKVKD